MIDGLLTFSTVRLSLRLDGARLLRLRPYRDGYPNVVPEAQTAGLTVVANDAYGMREPIADGESGCLVDPADSGMVRDRVEHPLADSDLR